MRSAIIIPARFQSTRLPGKPLLKETGKFLIEHTYEQARQSKADEVIIATDDLRIADAVKSFNGNVVMTSKDHETGSGRIAEAAQQLEADIILNVQGDEPEVDPESLNLLLSIHEKAMSAEKPAFVSTLVSPFASTPVKGPGSPQDPSCVKAVLSAKDKDGLHSALYFSRALIPYPRDRQGAIENASDYFLHIGLYAFSRESLMRFAQAPVSRLEQIEKLEQLRILEMGERIVAGVVSGAMPGIDTPEDYAAFVQRCR